MTVRKRNYEAISITGKVDTVDDLLQILNDLPAEPAPKRRSGRSVPSGPRALIEPLTRLKNMVGMEDVKKLVLSQLLYFLQGLHGGRLDMLHSVIQGPPGVGKTELATILGELYCSLGVLRRSKVIVARRSDLIGKYVGHTAIKTQQVIDDSLGGVLLIDEAYSLGNGDEDRDSFSKECLDTINQNLTENGDSFMCIIAGYQHALEKCFFSANEGLARRFTFRYTLPGYNGKELSQIFCRIVDREGWGITSQPTPFFETHHKSFPFFGGDMESLFLHAKLAHSKHLLASTDKSQSRKLDQKDLEEGLRTFLVARKSGKEDDTTFLSMYL